MAGALRLAAEAACRIEDAGGTIIAAYANGRRPVLIVAGPPPFVAGHAKRTHPNGAGGTTTVFAASYHGCQLEWMRETHARTAVGHG